MDNKDAAPAPKEYTLTEIKTDLGDKKDAVAKIINDVSKPLFVKPQKTIKEGEDADEDDEFDVDDDETMTGIEQTMAADIKKKLDAELGGNWNTIVGNRYSSDLNLVSGNKHGAFKFGSIFVDVFEANNY